jgi:hypothetical protein
MHLEAGFLLVAGTKKAREAKAEKRTTIVTWKIATTAMATQAFRTQKQHTVPLGQLQQ